MNKNVNGAARQPRDRRLDFIRGVAIITIALNHLSWLTNELGRVGQSFPTLTAFGYSSSAEIFFLLSGYLVGRLYVPCERVVDIRNLIKRSFDRAIKLYIFNVVIFVVLAAFSGVVGIKLLTLTGFIYVGDEPFDAMWKFLTLQGHPALLGILQYYFVFLIGVPLFAFVLVRSVTMALLASVLLYAAVQFFPDLNIDGGTFGRENGWAFNPMAWQLIFYFGLAGGRFNIFDKSVWKIDYYKWAVAFSALIFFGLTLVYVIQKMNGGMIEAYSLVLASKQNLGVFRLMHVTALLFGLLVLLDRFNSVLTWRPSRWIETVGSISLYSFLLTILLNYVGAHIWVTNPGKLSYWLIAVATVLGLIVFSVNFQRWMKYRPTA
ncbi:OpgC domain-containing protein [Rhodoferax ferrireducens]|uniref:OpgC domain-containing protein n=1 Tax=Rhodoferax ferrireducens TaxID=192843 RepID=UPI000E0CD60B|nr:OpgC domain-containing protein [Rhodoferax ferrireducens]